ncbi:MAG: KAP family P-loop NTPase fold protein, partial [Methylobacter sp.]
AIHGPWGSGKTSLLNFVKYYLAEDHKDAQPVIIDFNPWWFDDRAQLAAQFLSQFKEKLNLENKVLRNIGDLLADYSGSIGKAIAYSTGIPWLDKVATVLRVLKRKPKDVPALKSEIAKALKEANHRYFIVIDDIDRLTPSEIREVFKVVKALADFPNVVYMLSFERQVVADALSNLLQLDGEAYLEKIVQIPFVLPTVDRLRLQNKLFSDLNLLLDGADLTLFDQTYWGNVFMDGMAPLINKPRDVVRYVNALSVTYPAMRNEVNITDFFALEFLRVNLPKLYDTIRENPDRFTGYSSKGLQSGERKEDQEFHQAWVQELDERIRSGVQSMMERIFPKLDNMGRGNEFLNNWRRLRRAAHPDVFSCYFQFAVNSDQLSRQSITTFIERLIDPEETQETLLKAVKEKRTDGSSMAKEYLDYLLDYDTEIDPVRAFNMLKVLGQIGDKLMLRSDETGGFFTIRSHWRLNWAMQHALTRIHEHDRDVKLVSAFKEGAGLTFLCHAIFSIQSTQQEPVKHGRATVLTKIKPETVVDLKQLALSRIHEFVAENQLLDVPELPFVLYRWQDWEGPEASRRWAKSLVADKKMLLQFLVAFLAQSRSQAFGDSVACVHHSLNFKNLADFVDLEEVAAVLGQIGKDEQLEVECQLVVTSFNEQYPYFQQGKDPDNDYF